LYVSFPVFHEYPPFANKTFASGISARFVIVFLSLPTTPDIAVLPKILEKFKKYFSLLPTTGDFQKCQTYTEKNVPYF
jgi:hypothetical protein